MAPEIAQAQPRVSPPADEADVMREQLEYLIEHAAGREECGCAACRRYLRVRAILLEIFEDPRQAKVVEIAQQLAHAA